MKELKTKSLAQIVNDNFRSASVFEKYHLDFCCQGKRSLADACTESKIDITEVIKEIENLNAEKDISIDFSSITLEKLADYIVDTHHTYVKNELPVILGYLQKVAAKHGERHPEMKKVAEIFAAICEEMDLHMKKEEQVLFPRIKEIERNINEKRELHISNTYLNAPINMMEQEHDHAGSMTKEIRLLTGNYIPPADACTTYKLSLASLQAFELNLHQHVHLENNVLFPRAEQLFRQQDKAILN
jgi:regulator of cell morphogenesis and NO signaling